MEHDGRGGEGDFDDENRGNAYTGILGSDQAQDHDGLRGEGFEVRQGGGGKEWSEGRGGGGNGVIEVAGGGERERRGGRSEERVG